jgi:hypothetical protein
MVQDEVRLDPAAQRAVIRLLAREHRQRRRRRAIRLAFLLSTVIIAIPLFARWYCTTIIGTGLERIILGRYPETSLRMVRTAVIVEGWCLRLTAPVLESVGERELLDRRRAVIELGLATTGPGGDDPARREELRRTVAAGLARNPGGIAFAVYELPPRRNPLPPGGRGWRDEPP